MDSVESSDILVVDDSATVRAVLSNLLAGWGYRVRTAENGRRALASIAVRQPDIVVLDAMMPEMDGYEVCEVLRRREDPGEYIPVIMLTGDGDAARGLAAGADDFMTKPPKGPELAARLKKLIRLRRIQKTLEEKSQELESKNLQLQAQNEELGAMAGQLEAQNQQLIALTEQLEAQNQQHEAMAGQLEAQNQQLVAMAGELQVANEQLAYLSVTDGLTRAHNRRYFEERLHGELARAKRRGTPLSCVLIDIDHFKDVNDTYGHAAGDRVLVGLVELLRRSVRVEDVVCRYGGEEFALLLPETSADSAFALAERLRETVATTSFPLPSGDCLSITMSAGVIAYAPGESSPDPDAFVDTADQALFRAKRSGRNRVEMEAAVPGSGDLVLAPDRAQMAFRVTAAPR